MATAKSLATRVVMDADLVRIGELAITAHHAHAAWTTGRSLGGAYRGPDGQRDLTARKGAAERALREAIKAYIGE